MKNDKLSKILTIILAACLVLVAYHAGKAKGNEELTKTQNDLLELSKQQEELQMLNRSSIENMVAEDGIIYVIGHKSPDSDTVCSAIAYARLLNLLGHEAKPVITEPLNNETSFILKEAGVEVPEILHDASGENIFLVDHSEYAQAAEGLADAHVVGVLDHHGIGSVTTGNQVVYEGRPIGSTATIVWLDYLNYGLDIDEKTAFLIVGAVLSDTDDLSGSTTTEADREAVRVLSETAGITDADAFYRQLHAEKLSYEGMSDEEILFSDYKEYEASGMRFGIGLVSAIDEDAARHLSQRMKEALPEGYRTRNVDLMFAAVTIRENGEKIDYVVPCDEQSESVLKNAFPDYDEYDGAAYIFRKGLGRKTKLVPGLTDYLSAHPHE